MIAMGTITAMMITVCAESELLDAVIFVELELSVEFPFVPLVSGSGTGIGQTQSVVELELDSSPLGHTFGVMTVLLYS